MKKSRATFEDYFVKILKEIRIGKRKTPQLHKPFIMDLIDNIIVPAKEGVGFKLTGGFDNGKFYKAKMSPFRNKVMPAHIALPPHTENDYPIVKI